METSRVAVLQTALLVIGVLAVEPAYAGDIRVMTSGAFTAAYVELTP